MRVRVKMMTMMMMMMMMMTIMMMMLMPEVLCAMISDLELDNAVIRRPCGV